MKKIDLTDKQLMALGVVVTYGPCSARRVGGELGWRSQDAGRVLRALERKGLIVFQTVRGAGYVATA